jgi:CheY-like chemotaxis protein/anti-sigma regulatory factor (Ser/Thr protein kinase)
MVGTVQVRGLSPGRGCPRDGYMTKRRILVVDDEPHIRRIVSDVLGKVPEYEVETATDGDEALEKLRSEGFAHDLVLTDIMMPRLSGLELVRHLREEAPKVACVVLTAFRNDRNVARCLETGAFDFLMKPISVEQLLQTLRRAFDRYDRFTGADDDLSVQQQAEGWIEITAPSDFEYVERFQKFTAQLGDVPLGEDEREDIRVAIDELGQNAIEWGNREDRSKRINLSYCIFHDRIVFKIEDQGEGFSPEALSDPSKDPLAHIMNRMEEGKRAGGYGVYITRQLMDDVVYNEKGNVVLLTKLFNKPRPGTPS